MLRWLLAFSLFIPAQISLASEPVSVRVGGKALRGELIRVSDQEIVMKVAGREQTFPVMMVEPRDYVACAKSVLEPKNAEAHHKLGLWCREKGLKEEAADLLAHAARLDPSRFGEAPATPAALAPATKKPTADELIKALGHENGETRDTAAEALRLMGEAALPALKTAQTQTEDLEVKTRTTALIKELTVGQALAKLAPADRAIVELPFGEDAKFDGMNLSFLARGNGSCTVIDMGPFRIAIREQPYNGQSSGQLTIGGGGRSSSQAGSLKVEGGGGKASASFRGIAFKVDSYGLHVDGHDIPLDQGRQVVFLTGKGAFEVAVPLDKAPTPEK